MKCINCGKVITRWAHFKKLFYASFDQPSFLWAFACSENCYREALIEGIADQRRVMLRLKAFSESPTRWDLLTPPLREERR